MVKLQELKSLNANYTESFSPFFKMINIRPANPSDLEIILNFIKELADYENLANEVVANTQLLNECLFEKEKAFVLIAEYNGLAVGFALYFYNFSTFLGRCGIYLEDLYVKSDFRNLGIGKALFKELAQIARDNNFERIDFCCLNDNEPSLKFYEKIGAFRQTNWGMLRLDKSAITRLSNDN